MKLTADTITDEQIRDLLLDSAYPGEIYTKCQTALGAYGWQSDGVRRQARSDVAAFCNALVGYVADHGLAELSRESKRFARLIEAWKP